VRHKGYPSTYLRGDQVAKVLVARCIDSMDETENETVVFVKAASPSDVQKAKEQGCTVAYDVLDFFCYPDRALPWAYSVDVLITPNSVCTPIYKAFFPNARQVIIPHHWDPRIKGVAQHDVPRLGYIGAVFNMPKCAGSFEIVVEESKMLEAAKEFNLHLAVSRREDLARILKPATKIATASAVGACVIAYMDPSATELLGEEYPFYVRGTLDEAIDDALRAFGTERWQKARSIMQTVGIRTSLPMIAEQYKQMEAAYA